MRRESLEYMAIFLAALLFLAIINTGVITAQNTTNGPVVLNQSSTTTLSTTTVATTTSLSTTSSTTIPPSTTSPSTTIAEQTGGSNALVSGPFQSSVVQTALCYVIVNFTTGDSENFALNGTQFGVQEISIGTSGAVVSVNGTSYAIAIGNVKGLPSSTQYQYFALLDNISYIPIGSSVNLTAPYNLKPVIDLSVCGSPIANSATTSISTTSSTTVNSTTSTVKFNQTAGKIAQIRKGLANMSGYNASMVAAALSIYGIQPISNQTGFNTTNLTASQANLIRSSLAGTTANLSEVQLKVPYGSVRNGGRYVAQGTGRYYLSQGADGEVLYNVTITKAVPKLNVNINGYSVSASNVTVIHLPVVNGSLGINGGHTYSLKGSLSTSLLNNVNLSYTVSEGTTKLASANVNSSSLNIPINVTIPLNKNTTITFDSEGGANYTPIDPTVIIVPTNITYALPITFTNTGGVALKANTPLAVGVVGGKVIGFNALAYHQYELPGLNNTEFFYSNGTIVPSWMEGNILNEQTANGIATSFSSKNAIADSANVLFWVEIGSNAANFLPAGGTTNTIYLGFAGNTLSPENVLFNNVTTGEAPQLSCPVPSITATCAAYAEYDNGNSIFSFYDNFYGTVLNTTRWSATHTASPLTIANGLELGETGTTSAAMVSHSSYGGYPYWFEGMVLPTTTSATTKTLGFEESTSATKGTKAYDSGYFVGTNTTGNVIPVISSTSGALTRNAVLTSTGTRPNILGVSWITTGKINNAYNYNTNSITGNTIAIGNQFFGIVVTESATGTYDGFVQWVRARAGPPGNVLPASTVGSTGACIATLGLSNQSLRVGQIETIFAGEVGCAAPFTYNIIVSNSVSPGIITKNDLVTGNFLSSIQFTYTVTAVGASNSPENVNVIVKDAGSNTAIANQTLNVNFPLANVLLSLSPAGNAYAGQALFLNASWEGGTPPFTVNYIVSNSISMAVIGTEQYSGVQDESNTTFWDIPANDFGASITANVMVTGSSPKPIPENSPYASPKSVILPTVPVGIQYYLPITLLNNESSPVAANTPLPIGTTFGGTVTGIDATAYQQYETCSLDNAEFFFANGTVAQSWLEGNTVNELTANTNCASDSSTNALAGSANDLYWVDAPSSSFLAASSGVPTGNTIFLGWAGNVTGPANTLMDGITTGEAPQLSCDSPATTSTGCSAGEYGEYDNGNSIFSFYDNFSGTALNSQWSSTHGGTVTVTVSNELVIQATTTHSGAVITKQGVSGYPYWLEGYQLSSTTSSTAKTSGIEISNSVTFGTSGYDNGYFIGTNTVANVIPISLSSTGAATRNSPLTSKSTRPNLLGVAWANNSIANNEYNYNLNVTTSAPSHSIIGSEYFSAVISESATATYSEYLQWMRARIYPPGGINPAAVAGIVVQAPVVASTCFISLSNSIVNFGNIQPKANVPTANAITDTNTGTSPANVLIAGGTNGFGTGYGTGNWIGTSSANTIGISNTLYSLAPQGSYTGTAITNAITSIGLTVGAGGSNTVYLGMGVPAGTPADLYTTNIVLENSC